MSRSPKVLLFDMGGVLMELADPASTFGFDGGREAFLDRWLHSPSVREYECGAIDTDEFAERIVREAELDYDATEFIARFRRWPQGVFAGIPELIAGIPRHFTRALMSNTNALHWEDARRDSMFADGFDRVYLSFETGLLKPDDDAFMHICDDLDCEPADIAFFDDSRGNIEAATRLGIRASVTAGPVELTAALAGLGASAD